MMNQLDPGPLRRKSNSKRLFLSLCVVVSVAVVALGSYLFTIFVSAVYNGFFNPHKFKYHNTTIEQVTNRSSFVQPLVDRQQTFDLAATVWLRTSKEVIHVDGEYIEKDKNLGDAAPRQHNGEYQPVTEEPLFSDIIFRGVRLSDKHKLATTVNFSVPTELFRRRDLSNYDLRASVVLIPSSPSLLDYVSNYSSYIPSSVNILPVKASPFPLGSDGAQERSIADEALESFGSSVPLIQFHGIRSQCETTDPTSTDDDSYTSFSWNIGSSPRTSSLDTTIGKGVLKTHPYIVTRTQIRVLDEDQLFNLKTFEESHKKLKETACGQDILVHPNQFFCKAPYRLNGNWETLLELDVPEPSSGETHKEWAYAPFFYMSKYGLGQKDLLEIPVRREKCSTIRDDLAPEPATIDVSWKVSYVGRSPAKMNLIDLTEAKRWYDFDGVTEAQVNHAHDQAEMWHGLAGHRYGDDVHPRRRWTVTTLSAVLPFIIVCLDIFYWLTRTSTVSLSIPGTIQLASASIISNLDSLVAQWFSRRFSFWTGFLPTIPTLFLPIAQLKAVYSIEISFSGWIPTIRSAGETHMERLSRRMDSKTSRIQKVTLFVLVLVLYYSVPLDRTVLISAISPLAESNNTVKSVVPDFFINALALVGMILQIVLNWRSGSFGGKTRTSAFLTVVYDLLELVIFVPTLMGNVSTRGPLSVQRGIEILTALVLACQAIILPLPRETSYEEHEE